MRINRKKALEIMNEKGISQADIVDRTGYHYCSVNWIFNNGLVSWEALERIADAIETDAKEIAMPDNDSNVENTIDFIKDDEYATVSITQGRFKKRIETLAEERPDECRIVAKNQDGSTCARIPVAWIRITPPKKLQLTDEQRKERAEQMRRGRGKNEELSA